MATPTSRLKLKKQTLGSNLNQWGLSGGLNGAFDQVDVLAGYLEVNLASATSYTFGTTNYATTGNEHMYRAVKFSGSPSSGVTVNIPAVDDYKFVENATGQTITFSNGSTTATLANTFTGYIRTNGSSVITVLTLPDGVNVKTVADNIASVNQVATDSASVIAVAGKATEIGRLGTADAVADMALLGNTANVAAQALLGTSANVTAQGHLGTSANVTAQGHLGTSANVAAQALIGTSANVAAQALIGTSANVAAQALIGTSANIAIQALMGTTANIAAQALIGTTANVAAQALIGTTANVDAQALIGTSANITAQALIGTSANVAAQALIGTSANIAAQALIGTTANINAQALIGTSANIAVQALLGTSANVAAMALLGTSSNVTNMTNLGTSQNVTNMNTLSGISSAITGVNAISANVTAVNTDPLKSNINTTAGAVTNVNNVGTNIANVNSVASNMASVNSFGNTYQISTNNPTTGGDGSSSLADGMLAWVTSADKLRVYNATSGAWEDAGSAVNGTSARFSYTATANQTTFPASGSISYDSGFADTYLNGIKLQNGTDVTATSGTNIVLATGAAVGDIVDIVAYGSFNVSNTYTQAETNTLLAAKATNTDLATTNTAVATKAPLASPNFTGTPQIGGANILTSATAPSSGGTADFVAKGNLTNGMVVGLRADGKVEPISGVNLGDGTSTASTFAVSNSAHRCFSTCYDSTNDKTIIVYVDDVNVKAAVCTVTDNVLTFGTPVTIHSGGAALDTQTSVCHDPNVDRLLFVYSVASDNVTYLKVGQLSGVGLNSITLGNSTNLTAKASTVSPITTAFQKERPGPADVNVIVVAFATNSHNYLAISAITITGGSTNTAAFSTITDITSASTADADLAYFASDQRVVATYVKPGDTYNLQARALAWFGSSWSFGLETAIDNGYWTESQVTFDPQGNDSRGFVFARESLNNGYSSCWAVRCAGGSISAGSPVVVNSGDNGTYLGAATNGKNQAVLFYLVGSTVKSVFVSRSGATITAATPASFQSFGGTHNITIYDPDAKTFISVSRNPSDGILTAKTYAEAGSNNTSFIGISDAVTSNGATGAVKVFSGIKTGLSSLTPNKVYYVNATGVINDTATGTIAPVKIGRALSTSSLQITEAHT